MQPSDTARFLDDVINAETVGVVITVFDDGDPRIHDSETFTTERVDGVLTVTMSDPLYAVYCQLIGMDNANERQPEVRQ